MKARHPEYYVGHIHSIQPQGDTLQVILFSYETAEYIETLFHKDIVQEGQGVSIISQGRDVLSVIDTKSNKIIYDTDATNEGRNITAQEIINTWHDTVKIHKMYKLKQNQKRMQNIVKLYFSQYHSFYVGKPDIQNPGIMESSSIQLFMCNARNVIFHAHAIRAEKELYETYYKYDIQPINDISIIERHYGDFQTTVGKIPLPYQSFDAFMNEVHKISKTIERI